jgi:chromosome partitioning protein
MAGRVITIAQQKGGSGKTTLAAHLAVAAARANGTRVAILDTDPQGSLGRWYMTRDERHGGAVAALGFRTASAWGARYEARALAKDHDLVIIDTPPKMGLDGRPAIEAADLVVIPVTPSPVDLWATEPTVELARGENKPMLMVMNRAPARARVTADMARALDELGLQVAASMIAARVGLAVVMGDGLTTLEVGGNAKAAAEIAAVLEEVMAALERA